jgi:hypothetical protein
MSTTDAAATLRQRAATLRGFARQLTTTSALDLGRRAGSDTWIGPTPDACRSDLQRLRSDLLAAGDDLQAIARRFEQMAAELDVLPDPRGPR